MHHRLCVSLLLVCLGGCSHLTETIAPPPATPVAVVKPALTPVASVPREPVLSEVTEEAIYKAIIDANTHNLAEAQRRYHIPGNDEPESNTITHEEAKQLFDAHDTVLKELGEKSEATIRAKYHISPDTLERVRAKGSANGWPKSQLSDAGQKRLHAEWENGLTQIDERADAKYPRPDGYVNDPAFEKRRKAFEDHMEVVLKKRIMRKYHVTEEQLDGISMKALTNNW